MKRELLAKEKFMQEAEKQIIEKLTDIPEPKKENERMDHNIIYKQLSVIIDNPNNMSKREIIRRLKGLREKVGYIV